MAAETPKELADRLLREALERAGTTQVEAEERDGGGWRS